jgi:hypothetical protein
MINKFLAAIQKQKADREAVNEYRNLLRTAATIGGRLFGPIPVGHRREFFCLDKNTWIWHEEWIDSLGNRQVQTMRYDVRPDTILKTLDGSSYQSLSATETENLITAARNYRTAIRSQLSTQVA